MRAHPAAAKEWKGIQRIWRECFIRKINSTTPFYLMAMLWYHMKHQQLLNKMHMFM